MVALISGVALVLVSAALHPQAPPAQSPQDCVRQGRAFAAKRQRESQPLTNEIYRQIEAERVKMARDCAATFDVDKAPAEQLSALVELFTEAQQPELAQRALTRGLASQDVALIPRAELLVQAIRVGLRQRPKPDFATVEAYSDALDTLPDTVLDQKIAAHGSLNGYYRGDDVDAGIIKHSTWLIETGRRLAPELRKKHGMTLIAAYDNLAEAVAGQGENDRALELLRRATVELADVPKVEERLKSTHARYLLVGKPAAAVAAPVWLNRAEAAAPIEFKGRSRGRRLAGRRPDDRRGVAEGARGARARVHRARRRDQALSGAEAGRTAQRSPRAGQQGRVVLRPAPRDRPARRLSRGTDRALEESALESLIPHP